MKVIKEVNIKISSVIENLDAYGIAEGESEKTESEAVGYFHFDGGEALLTYTESAEGKDICSEIRYSSGKVSVKRGGAIESELIFEEGVCHKSVYSVPPYTFDAEVTTRRIRASLGVDGGSIDLYYNMKIGGAGKSARMKIWISTISSQI